MTDMNVKTIEIQSERYGRVSVTEDQIYYFPQGMVGLPDIKEYALFPLEGTTLSILHALHDVLSFILVPAFAVVPKYGIQLDGGTCSLLQLSSSEPTDTDQTETATQTINMLVVNIIDEHPYVNLKAPVILTPSTRRAVQFIMTDRDYPLRHSLYEKELPTCSY